MPTDLSPAERDDRETTRLIHKRPAPSRKNRSKRGPKHDNRRRRMKEKDPDAKAAERDRKASLVDLALKVAFAFEDDVKAGPGHLLTRADLGLPPREPEATSYGASGTEDMTSKTAAYHGVVQQGHPSGPTNSGHSPDKRYFDKSSYDSIVAHAKELLKTDWLKYGWDGGTEDAPVRAALDLSIQLANDHAYQSKIDVETYNMLLARLSKSDIDLFSDTLVPEGEKVKRSAAAMTKNQTGSDAIQSMVRIANTLRTSNPRMALEIMKNVRAIRVAQVPIESQIQHQSQQEQTSGGFTMEGPDGETYESPKNPSKEPSKEQIEKNKGGPMKPKPDAKTGQQGQQQEQAQQECMSQEQQQGGLTKGPNMKDVKHQLDLFKKVKTPDDAMEILQKLAESVKTSSSRTASDPMQELSPIADMSDEDLQKLIHMAQRDVTKIEQLIGGFGDQLASEEIDSFVKGMDDFFNNIVAESEKVKTASVSVHVSTLLRIASISPEAKMVMMPFLAAAKKKIDKAAKAKKKKAPKKKSAPKKGNPFAKGGPLSKSPAKGKKGPPSKGKAPPFGGKKAPPFGKKASVDISSDDTKW